jgi:16S rRNA (guanine1516-N2)-methyltransferase
MASLQIHTDHTELKSVAMALATQLNLPMADPTIPCDYWLVLTPDYLGLTTPNQKSPPFYIDFLSPKSIYRQKNLSIRNENLARALGLKNHKPNKIIDTTAGLGRDGFIIASLGIPVDLIERSPIIYALLADAIKRAQHHPTMATVANRMNLIQGNAITLLPSLSPAEVIYLDPMFPTRAKSALVKKEMQIFHEIIGADPDADALFKVALTCASRRVVVKRPKLANYLAELPPHYSVKGSSSRFDIYLTQE